MTKLFSQPIFLLVLTGFFIGLNFPLGKIAGDAGISPLLWSMLISLGVVFLLFPTMVVKKTRRLPPPYLMKYAVISGIVSFVAANILLFLVIPHVGSGYSGLMFALSPVFTLAISILFGFASPSRLGLAGIAVGFAGAAIVALSRQSLDSDVQWFWIFVAVLIPLSLATGNVYRSLAWPEGASPDLLAFWSHFFSVLIYLVLLLAVHGDLQLASLADAPVAAVMQMVVGGLTFPVFFRLQLLGGPVLLSQIGYVAAAVGLFAATVFLGETYGVWTWAGAGVILLGIALTIASKRKAKSKSSKI